jgi:uncharacterized protein (TIGR03086 family)
MATGEPYEAPSTGVLAAEPVRWLCDAMPSDSADQVLGRGLDQLGTLLRDVRPDDQGRSTPCSDWTVSDLVDHIVQTPGKFASMVRGDEVDWTAPTPRAADPVATYEVNAQSLRAALVENPDPEPGIDWQCAELAVHTWDLATALGRPTDTFDPEVAERGRAFMVASLTDDIRGDAFRPEVPAPPDADAYTRLAAFAGRAV